MKALVGAFNQEKALVGAFSVIVQPVVEPMDSFTALVVYTAACCRARILSSLLHASIYTLYFILGQVYFNAENTNFTLLVLHKHVDLPPTT